MVPPLWSGKLIGSFEAVPFSTGAVTVSREWGAGAEPGSERVRWPVPSTSHRWREGTAGNADNQRGLPDRRGRARYDSALAFSQFGRHAATCTPLHYTVRLAVV